MITEEAVLTTYIQENVLAQTELSAIEQNDLKGAALVEYSFSATMRLAHSNDSVMPAFGIMTHATGQEIIRVRLSKQTGRWSLIIENEGSTPAINRVLALADTFDPTDWHTLSLVQRNTQVHISLNGSPVLSIIDAVRITQPGLTTQNAGVEFINVRQTALS